jgi:hypothetical protein
MAPAKQRRYLIAMTVLCFVLWLVTTFILMLLWYVKGGIAIPDTKTVPIELYRWACSFYESLIFDIIPGLTFGYFVLGALFLSYLAKTKSNSGEKR